MSNYELASSSFSFDSTKVHQHQGFWYYDAIKVMDLDGNPVHYTEKLDSDDVWELSNREVFGPHSNPTSYMNLWQNVYLHVNRSFDATDCSNTYLKVSKSCLQCSGEGVVIKGLFSKRYLVQVCTICEGTGRTIPSEQTPLVKSGNGADEFYVTPEELELDAKYDYSEPPA